MDVLQGILALALRRLRPGLLLLLLLLPRPAPPAVVVRQVPPAVMLRRRVVLHHSLLPCNPPLKSAGEGLSSWRQVLRAFVFNDELHCHGIRRCQSFFRPADGQRPGSVVTPAH